MRKSRRFALLWAVGLSALVVGIGCRRPAASARSRPTASHARPPSRPAAPVSPPPVTADPARTALPGAGSSSGAAAPLSGPASGSCPATTPAGVPRDDFAVPTPGVRRALARTLRAPHELRLGERAWWLPVAPAGAPTVVVCAYHDHGFHPLDGELEIVARVKLARETLVAHGVRMRGRNDYVFAFPLRRDRARIPVRVLDDDRPTSTTLSSVANLASTAVVPFSVLLPRRGRRVAQRIVELLFPPLLFLDVPDFELHVRGTLSFDEHGVAWARNAASGTSLECHRVAPAVAMRDRLVETDRALGVLERAEPALTEMSLGYPAIDERRAIESLADVIGAYGPRDANAVTRLARLDAAQERWTARVALAQEHAAAEAPARVALGAGSLELGALVRRGSSARIEVVETGDAGLFSRRFYLVDAAGLPHAAILYAAAAHRGPSRGSLRTRDQLAPGPLVVLVSADAGPASCGALTVLRGPDVPRARDATAARRARPSPRLGAPRTR